MQYIKSVIRSIPLLTIGYVVLLNYRRLRWLTVSCTAMQRINEALLLFECTPA